MSVRLFRQTLSWQRVRLLVVLVAAIAWGAVIPVIYDAFSDVFQDLANSGAFPAEMMNVGSGSLFTLPGSITLGLQHPLAIAMVGIFAVGAYRWRSPASGRAARWRCSWRVQSRACRSTPASSWRS